jgi:hypothetical protein
MWLTIQLIKSENMRVVVILVLSLLALPAAAQMQGFTAPQYAALRDTAAKVAPLRLKCISVQKSAKHYWGQADSLQTELQQQITANIQLRRVLYNEIDLNAKHVAEEARLRRIIQRRGLEPSPYTHPAR